MKKTKKDNKNKIVRPCWDEYFMQITRLVATRSTCMRRKVGAIAVKDKRMLASGYNGAPSGTAHCQEIGCLREKLKIPSGTRHELCRGLHAEQNVLLQASLYGVALKGATLYCTTQPCVVCAKMIINAGIKEIIIEEGYPDPMALEFFKEAKVRIRKYSVK